VSGRLEEVEETVAALRQLPAVTEDADAEQATARRVGSASSASAWVLTASAYRSVISVPALAYSRGYFGLFAGTSTAQRAGRSFGTAV